MRLGGRYQVAHIVERFVASFMTATLGVSERQALEALFMVKPSAFAETVLRAKFGQDTPSERTRRRCFARHRDRLLAAMEPAESNEPLHEAFQEGARDAIDYGVEVVLLENAGS